MVSTVYYEIPETNYNKCTKKNDDDVCTGCDTTSHYLLQSACVDYEKNWTSATDYTIIDAPTDCKKTLSSDLTKCEECKTGFVLDATAATCSAQQVTQPTLDCMVLDTNKCTKCIEKASLYTKDTTTICCKWFEEGEKDAVAKSPFRTMVAASDFLTCQPYMFEIEKCLHYD